MMRTLLALAAASSLAVADTETETFEGGFTNPFFMHDFEFDRCCWGFAEDPTNLDNTTLHLMPNFDIVTFDVPDGMRVRAVSVRIYDLEGGFVGDRPTSVMSVRGASGDFVSLTASEIAVWTELSADEDTIGQLFGEPLGAIERVDFQAANEGNSLVPGVGAHYDDIVVELEPIPCGADLDGDGDADADDFFIYLDLFAAGDEAADLDRDGDIDADDFFAYLDLFAAGC